MRTKLKKLTSVCLAVIMILSMLTVAPFTVGAAETDSARVSDTYTSGDFEYEIVSDSFVLDIPRGTAMITGYTGNMSDLNIPEQLDGYSVSCIGFDAFMNCNTIINLTIPDSVIVILIDAFCGCENLKNVYIKGENLNHIFHGAFAKCKNLEKINIPNSVYYLDGVAMYGYGVFQECISLTEITLPNNIKEIGSFNFSGCTSLTSITIPDSVTTIGSYAFKNCTSLASITIPYGVTEIGGGAFGDCTSLASVTIPNGVTEIGDFTFSSCTSLASVTIPNGVTKIGDFTFSSCTNLSSVTLPDSVTKIGDRAFNECISLTKITIPKSVTNIREYAFGYTVTFNEDKWAPEYNKIEGFRVYGYAGSAAETYANENGFDFVPINDYTDVDSQIIVSAGTDAELKVAEITNTDEIEQVNLKLENEKVESLYDISFVKDGATVQPDGTVTVKIPCTNENSKVYRVGTDESLTDMNAVYDNGYMVFSTNHFSLYVLTSEKPDALLGDVNGDGKISIDDVTDIQKYIANTMDFTEEQMALADVDKDEKVVIDDVTLIQKHLAGMAVIE